MNCANPVKGWRIPHEWYLVSWDLITAVCFMNEGPAEGSIKGSFTSVVFRLHIHLWLLERLFHNSLLSGAFFSPPAVWGVILALWGSEIFTFQLVGGIERHLSLTLLNWTEETLWISVHFWRISTLFNRTRTSNVPAAAFVMNIFP